MLPRKARTSCTSSERLVRGVADLLDGAPRLRRRPLVGRGVALVEIDDLLHGAARAGDLAPPPRHLQIPLGLDEERHRASVDGLDPERSRRTSSCVLGSSRARSSRHKAAASARRELALEAHLEGDAGVHVLDPERARAPRIRLWPGSHDGVSLVGFAGTVPNANQAEKRRGCRLPDRAPRKDATVWRSRAEPGARRANMVLAETPHMARPPHRQPAGAFGDPTVQHRGIAEPRPRRSLARAVLCGGDTSRSPLARDAQRSVSVRPTPHAVRPWSHLHAPSRIGVRCRGRVDVRLREAPLHHLRGTRGLPQRASTTSSLVAPGSSSEWPLSAGGWVHRVGTSPAPRTRTRDEPRSMNDAAEPPAPEPGATLPAGGRRGGPRRDLQHGSPRGARRGRRPRARQARARRARAPAPGELPGHEEGHRGRLRGARPQGAEEAGRDARGGVAPRQLARHRRSAPRDRGGLAERLPDEAAAARLRGPRRLPARLRAGARLHRSHRRPDRRREPRPLRRRLPVPRAARPSASSGPCPSCCGWGSPRACASSPTRSSLRARIARAPTPGSSACSRGARGAPPTSRSPWPSWR